MNKIVKADDKTFKSEVLDLCTVQPILVSFSQEDCGHCETLAPAIQKLAAEGKVKVVQVEAGEKSKVADQYKVAGTPTLALFKCGKMIASTGDKPPQDLKDIKAFIEKNKDKK